MNVVRIILLPFSWVYGFVIRIRNICYDASLFTVHKVNVPVISVGNLTAGGTGKTPFVEYLVRYLLSRGKKVSVISRGYKRATQGMFIVSDGTMLQGNAGQSGDEPYQIVKKFPPVVVIADEKRARAAQYAVEHFGIDCLLLDDGFQHRSLYRDIDIVMIDGSVSLQDIHMLPSVLRREPLSALKRAGVLAVSKVSDLKKISDDVHQITSAPVISVEQKISGIVKYLSSASISSESLKGQSCMAFCGIGNPESFRTTLNEVGLHITNFMKYADHYKYSIEDLKKIEKEYLASESNIIITTEKDAVKFSQSDIQTFGFAQSLVYLEIETIVSEGKKILHQQIDSLFNRKK